MTRYFPLAAVLGGCVSISSLVGQAPAKIDFKRDVQPIFKAHCYECHGATLQMHGFRLDRRRDAMKGGTLAMIGPGNADGSRLYLKLVGNQFGPSMPPAGKLKSDQVAIIKAWIDQGARWPDDVSGEVAATTPDPRATSLMKSLRNGDPPGFRKALSANPEVAKLKGPGGSTPLMYAGLFGDVAAMRLLLEKGADPNVRNDAGATALMWVVDDLEKTRLLVEKGADVNAKSEDGRTPLIIAAGIHGNSPVMKLLLDHGARVSETAPALFGQTTPLTEAAQAMDEAGFRMLVDRGADLKSAGPLALAFSMRAGCGKCIDAFMKDPSPAILIPTMFFVSPPLGPAFGVTPLVEHGADANAKDPQGNHILALVASSDAFPVDAVKALLSHGADVNAKSAAGESALELARRHGPNPVADILLKAGARDSVAPSEPAMVPKPAANPRAAVARSLPLLQSNDLTFLHKSGCVSCHNNTLTALTLVAARKSGIRVDEQEAEQQRKLIGTYLDSWRDRVLQNQGIPGDSDTVGYILMGLAAANYPSDDTTDAMARFLKRQQLPDGHWPTLAARPPIESSDVQVTAVSARAIQLYTPPARRREYEQSVATAAAWLAKAQPKFTEERAFRLLGLVWLGGDKETIRNAASALLAEQRPDGGWSQIPTLPSDAYATGQALTALQSSGALTMAQPAGKRAVEFLMNSQAEDGSWHVKRRAVPIQPFFESGFPYGRDQFVSASATNWATTALAMAVR